MYISETDRNGLSPLKFLLEALCSTSSCRHRYRKTSMDIQQRSILSLPRFPLSFPPCAASFLLRQRKWNPVRDAIRATFVPLLDQRYFVLHLESALRPSNTSSAFESADTFPSYFPSVDISYENRVRASSNQWKSKTSKYNFVIYEILSCASMRFNNLSIIL